MLQPEAYFSREYQNLSRIVQNTSCQLMFWTKDMKEICLTCHLFFCRIKLEVIDFGGTMIEHAVILCSEKYTSGGGVFAYI